MDDRLKQSLVTALPGRVENRHIRTGSFSDQRRRNFLRRPAVVDRVLNAIQRRILPGVFHSRGHTLNPRQLFDLIREKQANGPDPTVQVPKDLPASERCTLPDSFIQTERSRRVYLIKRKREILNFTLPIRSVKKPFPQSV